MAERLPSLLLEAYAASGSTTLRAVADVARGVHCASPPVAGRPPPAFTRSLKLREVEALRQWSTPYGLGWDAAAFDRKWNAQGCVGGQENDVYLEEGRIFKRNNLSFHLSYADFFDRLALHNLLFRAAPLQMEGFVDAGGPSFWPVMSQPAVRAKRGARRDEVAALMKRLDFVRVRNDDYRHPAGILVEDLHDENVFLNLDGEVIVIDPVIYVEPAPPIRRSRKSASPSSHPSRRSLLP
jgi:serine/threonin/tyrosin kinase-like protein